MKDLNIEREERRAHYMAFAEVGEDWSAEMSRRHQAFYSWLAEAIGVTDAMLPVPLAECLSALVFDRHMNNIELHLWDRQHEIVSAAAARAGLRSWALMDTTCVLKAYVVAHAEES